jgi:FKBP-type peptidyl-prolyl cis-trans isomerase (trigger factor)
MLSSTLMENDQKNSATPTPAEQSKTYASLKKLSDKHGEVEFRAEIPTEVMAKYEAKALAATAQNFELPGFRKGKVPEAMIRERVDEMHLLEDAADYALRDAVRDIMRDEKLSIVGSPRLTITKIAPRNPIEFKVMFALYPEVKLPDYKKIGAEVAAQKTPVGADGKPEVTEAEMKEAITRLLAMLSLQNPEIDQDKDRMPELTDELVGKLGAFKSVDEFKIKLRENLAQDKELQAKEARREELMKKIVDAAKVEIPDMLVDEEWYAFEERRNAELEQAGLKLDDYLKQIKKSAEDLEKEERAMIATRIKTSVVFRAIQQAEKIEPSEREVQTNIAYLKMQYKDRSEAWLRETAEALIIQEKIFALLGLSMKEDEPIAPIESTEPIAPMKAE